MVIKYKIKYKDQTADLYFDDAEGLKLTEQAVNALHKAKPVFPYGRKIIQFCAYNYTLYFQMARKDGSKLGIEIYWDDISDAIPAFDTLIENKLPFPNALSEESKINLQKLMMEKAGDETKYMLNSKAVDGKARGELAGEYDD